MNPFKKFDKIVVINLKQHHKRLEQFKKQAEEYGIDFEIFPAIKHEVGSWGCSLSHLEIIKQAKKDGFKNILVFEDDAFFIYPKYYVWNEVNKFFKTECDVFYLGCIAAWGESDVLFKNGEYYYDSVLGRHALAFNNSFFDKWIKAHPTFEDFQKDRSVRGDVLMANINAVKKGCFPVAAVNAEDSTTGTNAIKISDPLPSGKDHQRLILSAYAAKGLLDFGMLKKDVADNLFKKSQYLEKRIRELFLKCDPFMFIDETRYINLFKDSDRKNQMEDMFQEYGIKAKRFNAIKNENGWSGSTLSHRGCVLLAKMMNRKNVLVFEDDAVFIHDPEKMKKMLMQAIYDSSNDYEILYFGLTLNSDTEKINEDLYKVNRGWGLYAYLVNEKCYDKILNLFPDKPDNISQENQNVSDVIVYNKIQPMGKCKLVPVCSTRNNHSNNWQKESSDVFNLIIDGYKKHLKTSVSETSENEYKKALLKLSEPSGIIKSCVINLDTAKERLVKFHKNQKQTQLKSKRIKPVDVTDSRIEKAIQALSPEHPRKKAKFLSNQLTFSDILASEKAEKVIIFEDDVIFKNNFDEVLEGVLSELPEDFAICFLGCYLRRNVKLEKYSEHLIEIKENIKKIVGAHAILFNKSVYKKISDALKSPESKPTDSEIAELLTGKERCFIANPMICFQSGAESSLGHKLNLRRFERENIQIIKNNLTEIKNEKRKS